MVGTYNGRVKLISMRKISCVVAVLLLLVVSLSKEPILVTLFQKPEESDQSDFVEIVLKLGEKGTSLPSLFDTVNRRASEVITKGLEFCGEPDKKRCQESVEIGEPEIQSKYQAVKKVDTFVGKGYLMQHSTSSSKS